MYSTPLLTLLAYVSNAAQYCRSFRGAFFLIKHCWHHRRINFVHCGYSIHNGCHSRLHVFVPQIQGTYVKVWCMQSHEEYIFKLVSFLIQSLLLLHKPQQYCCIGPPGQQRLLFHSRVDPTFVNRLT